MKKYFFLSFLFTVVFIPFSAGFAANDQQARIQMGDEDNSQATAGPGSFFGDQGWDPFEEMERMQQNMNRFVQEAARRMQAAQPAPFFEPDLDMQESADAYHAKMDLPGMQKDQIHIEASGNALAVSGERKIQNEQQQQTANGQFYQLERSSGSFRRTIPLPADAKVEQISAKYENGVLEIIIPKAGKEQEKKGVPIAIQ